MANPFGSERWEIELVDDRDGESWKVTLRTPVAIDTARFVDAVAMEAAAGTTKPGTAQLQEVVDAVCEWTLPGEPDRESIANLREEIYTQIRKAVEAGPPTAAPKKAPQESSRQKQPEPSAIGS